MDYDDTTTEFDICIDFDEDYQSPYFYEPINLVDLITEKHFGGEKKSIFHDIFIPEFGWGK